MTKLTDAALAKSITALTGSVPRPGSTPVPTFAELRLAANSAALAETVAGLENLAKLPANDPEQFSLGLRLCMALRDLRLRASAKALWKQLVGKLADVPLEVWIPAAPSSEAIEAARKKTAMPVGAMLESLLKFEHRLFETAGAEWVLARGKPVHLGPLLDDALDGRPRPRGLNDGRKLIASFLKRDPKGNRVLLVASRCGASGIRLARLMEATRETLPLHVARLAVELPEVTSQLLQMRFADEIHDHRAVQRIAAEIARIGASILSATTGAPSAQGCMEVLAGLAAQIRTLYVDRPEVGWLWTFEPINRVRNTGAMITAEGARQWALVFQRARLDGRELGYLEAFAANVGIKEFSVAGEEMAFRPQLHEDTEGGLLAGDQVTVISAGWQFAEITLVKARVRAKGT